MPPDKLYQVLQLRVDKGWVGILSPRALRVDLVLLHHYNWKKREAFPNYNTLCRVTEQTRNTVSEALKELAFYGLWEILRTVDRADGKVRRANGYRLPPELVPDPPPALHRASPQYLRMERLASLQEKAGDSSTPYTTEAAKSSGRQSRATSRRQSRASPNRQFQCPGGELRSEQRR